MKTESLFLKEFICSCCLLALPCKRTTEPLLRFQQSCLWTVAYWGLLPVLPFCLKEKKKIVLGSEKNLDFSSIHVLNVEMTSSPQICGGTGNCIECFFFFFHFTLNIMRLLVTIKGTSAFSLEWRDRTVKRQWKEGLRAGHSGFL